MNLKTLLTTALILAGVASAKAAKLPNNITSIAGDTTLSSVIIAPESFETDTHELMKNWYLTNYAILDKDVDKAKTNFNYTDQDYIDCLQSLNTIIEMPYNKPVRAFIDMYVERKKSLVEAMLGMSIYYMPIFEQALEKHGMPLELKYLPVIESALNPNAVSRAGATGLWQFMLGTARGEGLEVSSLVDMRRDPYRASDAAARYLKKLFNTYEDWSLAIAAYNCGPGNVNKAIRRAGGGKKDFWQIYPYLPTETRGYVPCFIAANYAMNFYNRHGISPALASKPIITDSVHVSRRVHFKQISDVLGIPMDELRILNPQYRQDIIPGDVNRQYPLVLPNIQAYSYIAHEDSIVNHNADLYARRSVVEPSTGRTDEGASGEGEYVSELVVKYHKVGRNETLASIAAKYGVSKNSIAKTNKVKRVRRGQTLKINTYRRRWIPAAKPENAEGQEASTDNVNTTNDSTTVSVDNQVARALTNTKTDNGDVKQDGKKNNNASERPEKRRGEGSRKKERTATPTTYTVAAGDNLYKIAQKNGVSVEDLKRANNMKDDNIQAGAKLTIPSKNQGNSNSQAQSKSRSTKASKGKKSSAQQAPANKKRKKRRK